MISAYMVDDLSIMKSLGFDSWGESLGTIEISTKGYIKYRTKLVRDINGNEVVSSALVKLHKINTDTLLKRELIHEDRLKINGVERGIIAIAMPKAFSDPQYEVDVQ